MTTTGSEVVIAAWRLLSVEEREQTFQKIGELRAIELAGEESESARMIRSLRQVIELTGPNPSPDQYRGAWRELREQGEDIPAIHEQIRHWGSWRKAKEAAEIADTATARQVDARFRFRKLGKIWRYTEATLGETLAACAGELGGRPPTVAEFEHWREREIEKARATGDHDRDHLPSTSPYRRRWQTWEGALLHFGYTPEQTTERFAQN